MALERNCYTSNITFKIMFYWRWQFLHSKIWSSRTTQSGNLNEHTVSQTTYVKRMHRTDKYSQHSSIINHLDKWLMVRLRTKWLSVRVSLQSLRLQISHLLWARSSLTFRQLKSVNSLLKAYVWHDKKIQPNAA